MSLEQLFRKNQAAAFSAEQAAARATLKNVAMDGITSADIPAKTGYALSDLSSRAASTVLSWVETTDLAENESYADRLDALIMGQCDMDGNGEIGDDENDLYQLFWGMVGDFLQEKGASYEDVDAIANGDGEQAAAAGERVADLIAESLPDGEDAEMDLIDNFSFDAESTGSIFDAAYKKTVMVRDGKKVRKNKRVSGTVHLSGAQKAGLKKARLKSHGARATMRRMKSMKVRKKLGL